ncbi:MAG: MBL fold metallo-hydrolase [Candidatus Andersenbacteria bacterium]|nr:MBL fold metallo-hydrolase [Candidatus Andersenbacteria bacterium]
MIITFYGGAGGVTGSKHLVEAQGKRLLLDCGLFQGLQDVRERNRALPFEPDSIDGVVLSHAHVDHCGMLPILVKRGFAGKIYATPATRDVAYHMMKDAAGIEVQDAIYRAKHKIGAPDDRVPLYTPADVEPVMERFEEIPYARHDASWHELWPGWRLKFYDAGHILGSAITMLEVDNGGGKKRLVYTGDVGAKNVPLLYDPEVPEEEVETVLTESTYGGRDHEPLEQAIERMAQVINKVVDRGGKIIVPAFSLGRTQMIVYILHKLTDEKKIPRVPIFVDSPLAVEVTDVFKEHKDDYDKETVVDFSHAVRPLTFRNLTYVRDIEESKSLNVKPGPYVVISASGMMSSGRVVHHLRHSISDPRNAVLITGYQAQGTMGRQLLEGVKKVELLGDLFPVKAEVEVFNEFSAHPDHQELKEYLGRFKGVKRVFLVHGEAEQAEEFKRELERKHPEWQVRYPMEGESWEA